MVTKFFNILGVIILIFLVLSFVIHTAITFSGNLDRENLAIYTYTFFLANTLVSNSMFNLGRNQLFTYRHSLDCNIYYAALSFLIAALVGLVSSGITFIITRPNFRLFGRPIDYQNIGPLFSIFLISASIASIFGLVYFAKWWILEHREYNGEFRSSYQFLTEDQLIEKLKKAKDKYNLDLITEEEYLIIKSTILEDISSSHDKK